MEWQETINDLRKYLDRVEEILADIPVSDRAKASAARGFITMFAQDLYPEQEGDNNEVDGIER